MCLPASRRESASLTGCNRFDQAPRGSNGAFIPVAAESTARVSTRRQQPVLDAAGLGLAPEDIAGAVVVEIADACDGPAGGMRAEIDARRPVTSPDFPDLY